MYDVFAVYIALDDGRELFRRVYRGVPANSKLLTGFIIALNSFCEETTGSTVDEVRSGDIYYLIKYINPIFVIMVTSSRENAAQLVETIALRFVKMYGKVLQYWNGHLIFDDFKYVLDEILQMKGTHEEKILLEPDKVLDSVAIVSLNASCQKTALALIEMKRGTVNDIAKNANLPIDSVKTDLKLLIKMGYVGKIVSNGIEWYFVK